MGFRLRSLMNVRAPMAADETFLAVQDDYLRPGARRAASSV